MYKVLQNVGNSKCKGPEAGVCLVRPMRQLSERAGGSRSEFTKARVRWEPT